MSSQRCSGCTVGDILQCECPVDLQNDSLDSSCLKNEIEELKYELESSRFDTQKMFDEEELHKKLMADEIKQLKNELKGVATLTAERNELENLLAASQDDVREQMSLVDQMKSDREDLHMENRMIAEYYRNEILKKDKYIETLKQANEKKSADMTHLKHLNEDLERRIHQLGEANLQLLRESEERKRLAYENDTLLIEKDVMAQEIKKLANENAKMRDLEAECEKLQWKIKDQQSFLEATSQDNQVLKESNKTLEDQMEKNEKERKKEFAMKKELEATIEKLKNDMRTMLSEAAKKYDCYNMEVEFALLKMHHSDLKVNFERTMKEKEELNNEIHKLMNIVEQLSLAEIILRNEMAMKTDDMLVENDTLKKAVIEGQNTVMAWIQKERMQTELLVQAQTTSIEQLNQIKSLSEQLAEQKAAAAKDVETAVAAVIVENKANNEAVMVLVRQVAAENARVNMQAQQVAFAQSIEIQMLKEEVLTKEKKYQEQVELHKMVSERVLNDLKSYKESQKAISNSIERFLSFEKRVEQEENDDEEEEGVEEEDEEEVTELESSVFELSELNISDSNILDQSDDLLSVGSSFAIDDDFDF